MNRYRFFLVVAAMAAITFTLGTDAALASTGSDPSAPWAPLNNLTTLLTGTPAKVISIIAIVVAGIALIFGEDLGAFAKRLLMVVIATAMIMGSTSIISSLGFKSADASSVSSTSASGALIEESKR